MLGPNVPRTTKSKGMTSSKRTVCHFETWILKQTLSLKLNPCRQHILRSSIEEENLPEQNKYTY